MDTTHLRKAASFGGGAILEPAASAMTVGINGLE